jgi:hypothetical protein
MKSELEGPKGCDKDQVDEIDGDIADTLSHAG